MDIVYVIGPGSDWKDNEIRYSLRSLNKHADKVDKIILIGHDPGFLSDVIHIKHPDPNLCKERNIMEKILRACDEPGISENFFLMHDDHFFLQDFSPAKYPFYYQGTLEEYYSKANKFGKHSKAVLNTINVLKENKLPGLMFNVHHPIVINKKKFKKVMKQYDWEIENGYAIKSLYCNTLSIEGTPTTDCKIKKWLPMEEINKALDGKPFFSLGNAFSQDMRTFLEKTYPEKSPWEN